MSVAKKDWEKVVLKSPDINFGDNDLSEYHIYDVYVCVDYLSFY